MTSVKYRPFPGNPNLQWKLVKANGPDTEEEEGEEGFSFSSEYEENDKRKEKFVKKEKRSKKGKEEEEEIVFKKPKVISQKSDISKLEQELEYITRVGAEPLHSFIGMVAIKIGENDVRNFYEWSDKKNDYTLRSSLVKTGAKNVQEFLKNNRHLGSFLLEGILEKYEKKQEKNTKLIQSMGCFNWTPINPEMSQRERDQILLYLFGPESPMIERYSLNSRIWLWEVFPSSIFRFVLSSTSVGAMEMALSEIHRMPGKQDFSMKELICSDGVADMFAQLVAYKFLTFSGGNAYPGRVHLRGNGITSRTFNISAGFATRNALARDMIGLKMWFKNVYRVPIDKRPYLKEIRESGLYDDDQIEILKLNFPKHTLKYVEK